jgi:hypothetical protein
LGGMFIKVVKGKVTKTVFLAKGGTAADALIAAGITNPRRLTVTGVSICGGTRLRPDDIMYVE